MLSIDLTPQQAQLGLRALKTIALANGEFADAERSMLTAAADALGIACDVDALATTAPEEIAREFPPGTPWRERIVQAQIVMSIIDGEPTRDEVDMVQRFAEALGVEENRIHNLHQIMDKRLRMLRFDILRSQPLGKQLLKEQFEEKGLKAMWMVLSMMTRGETPADREVAWRYKQLGLLPEGTLGREFWKHMTSRKFALPGEPGGIPEAGIHHDMTHVLLGYGTDPEGEVQVASFYAGYYREDPFAFVFMVLVMFHLGIKVSPIATVSKGLFDPKKSLRAMKLGSQINIDLTDHWDHWSVVDKPIDDVRRMYNVLD